MDTEPLFNLTNLSELSISGANLVELDTEPLSGLSNLEHLVIDNIDYSNEEMGTLTNLNIVPLSKLKNLSSLYIYGAGITNFDVTQLSRLSNLIDLQIYTANLDITSFHDIIDFVEYTFTNKILINKKVDENDCLQNFNFTSNGMSVSSFISNWNFSDSESGRYIEIKDGKNQEKTKTEDEKVGTGDKIIIKSKETNEPLGLFTVLYYGDTDGNGVINALDALGIIKNKNGQIPFTDEIYCEAGRIKAKDGATPSAVDALAIIKHATGQYTIDQSK